MFSTRRFWTLLAVAALTTAASAQVSVHKVRGGFDPVGDKFTPTVDVGTAMCFGDGTGTPCPAGNVGLAGHGCENSVGLGGGLLSADGQANVSQDTVALWAGYLPTKTTVIFMQAEGCRNGELGLPFGDGLMCMGRSTMKLGVFRTDDGNARFPAVGAPPCFASVSLAGCIPLRGGDRYYQAMYRDHASKLSRAKFNLTNALAIEWKP